MTEQVKSPPLSEQLLQQKDQLLSVWQQLPPEHQATMALILIDRVILGDWGQWLREALTTRYSDKPFQPDNPEQLKGSILTHWRRLSPEDQAEVMVEQLKIVMPEEIFQRLVALKSLPTVENLEPSPVNLDIQLTKEDFKQIGFSEVNLSSLTDDDLKHISHTVRDHFINDVFWGEVEEIALQVLEDKITDD